MEGVNPEKAEKLLRAVEAWGRANRGATLAARREASHTMSYMGASTTEGSPLTFKDAEALAFLAGGCFELGYYLGRTYQDVPKVFKDALK